MASRADNEFGRPALELDHDGAFVSAENPLPVTIEGATTFNTWVPNATQADQALTIDDTAGGVQLADLHADTTQVFWDCQGAQVRVTFDGSAPTASNGHILQPGDCGVWPKALAAAAKFIRTGATSAVLHASQLKEG